MLKRSRLWTVIFFVVVGLMLAPSAALAQGNVVTVLGVWGGQELEAFQKVMQAFTEKTGIEVQFEGTRDLPTVLETRLQAGNPPDVAAIPGPGAMKQYAERGALVDLSKHLDMDVLAADLGPAWIELGSYGDGFYGLMISAVV